MIMIVMTLQRPKNLSIKREYPIMKFKKHMKNTMLKNSNTHWAMETEITIPLSLKKQVYVCFKFIRSSLLLKGCTYDFFKLQTSCYLVQYYKLFVQTQPFVENSIFNLPMYHFYLPFPFPVLILTNQFFNSIILFFYSFEAKVKKNSFKQVRSNDKVNFQ